MARQVSLSDLLQGLQQQGRSHQQRPEEDSEKKQSHTLLVPVLTVISDVFVSDSP